MNRFASFFISLFAAIALLTAAAPVAATPLILVIKSSDNRFFKASVDSLRQNLPSGMSLRSITLDSDELPTDELRTADLVITLGLRAADALHHRTDGTHIIHAYLTEFQFKQHGPQETHTSILLDQPLERYIRFTRLLLDPRSIAILSSNEQPLDEVRLTAAGKKHDIDIVNQVHRPDDNLMQALRQTLSDSDALLALPAPDIYNSRNLKGILLTAYRLRKPMISYSPSHVGSGALGAIFTSPENIGKQLADLANNILRSPGFQPHPFYFAADFDIAINDNVARSLNLKLPTREHLLRQMREAGSR